MASFDSIYQELLRDILENGYREKNKRTGHETAALPGVTFSVDLEKDGFPLLGLRKIPVRLFVAEQIWFISGARKPEDFLREFTHIWDDFTNPGDVLTTAYGYRWRRHFGRDQLGKLVALLEKDPTSRHGVVMAWDPGQDGLGGTAKANVPCPFTFTVMIIGGRLHMMNVVRSNDTILGLPHDVAGFALLQTILAARLGVKPGVYTHTIANAHIYDIHYDAAAELIERKLTKSVPTLQVPKDSFERATAKDVELVVEIVKSLRQSYVPQPAIKGLKIVL